MLLTILIQGACKKETDADPMTDEELSYISREEFMSKLQGEWSASYFSHVTWTWIDTFHVDYQGFSISFTKDSCQIQWTDSNPQMYPLNDPILCTFGYMEKIQNWTITNNNDDLILKTKNKCSGDTATYQIRFSNYRYDLTWDGQTGKKIRGLIHADIQLLYSMNKPDEFWFDDKLKEFGFYINIYHYEKEGCGELYRFKSTLR
jgi:hypothetical protein